MTGTSVNLPNGIVGPRLSRREVVRHLAAGSMMMAGATGMRGQSIVSAQVTPTAATPSTPPPLHVRKNATSLTVAERHAFVRAVWGLKTSPSPWEPGISIYDQFVTWHRDAFTCSLMAAHMGPAFFPWHRMFLLLVEQQLQAIDPTVTIPYWDWTRDRTGDASIWADDFLGGNGDPNDDIGAVVTGPFRKGEWEIVIFDDIEKDPWQLPYLVRDFGAWSGHDTLPTPAEVDDALLLSTYDVAPWSERSDPDESFRSRMEGWRNCEQNSCVEAPAEHPDCAGPSGLHNEVHLWVAGEREFTTEEGMNPVDAVHGTMAHDSSPNDPVFFLHHANVDRIWAQWQERHGRTYEPVSGAPSGHNLNDAMWPFFEIGWPATPQMLLSHHLLGYAYDTEDAA